MDCRVLGVTTSKAAVLTSATTLQMCNNCESTREKRLKVVALIDILTLDLAVKTSYENNNFEEYVSSVLCHECKQEPAVETHLDCPLFNVAC